MDGIPLWAWPATLTLVVALLALDFVVAARRPHVVGLAEASFWSLFYVGVAVLFGFGLWLLAGADIGTQYLTGWLVEKSLSADNLFVFVIILRRFQVPPENHQKVLLFGIAAALVLRVAFIAVGATALALFSPTFLVFGLVLIWTAVQLVRHRNEDPDIEDDALLRLARRVLPTTPAMHGSRLVVRVDGRRTATPLLLAFIAIGSTDLLFALDSIPAVFGVTSNAFVVVAANAFALLGLRALYFLVEGLLSRLVYLSLGLSVILALIGVKLVLEFLHQDVTHAVPEIPTPLSLGVIVLVLVVTTVASLLRSRAHPTERAHPGAVHRRRERDGRHGGAAPGAGPAGTEGDDPEPDGHAPEEHVGRD